MARIIIRNKLMNIVDFLRGLEIYRSMIAIRSPSQSLTKFQGLKAFSNQEIRLILGDCLDFIVEILK